MERANKTSKKDVGETLDLIFTRTGIKPTKKFKEFESEEQIITQLLLQVRK